ncbi:hypothetical protein [Undibacterium sp. TJN19]|uniref:hypothetical protein n=1 Tax=Undibacterium sp. TJN19 TaxID=3413055 RepID=UPI003BF02BB8
MIITRGTGKGASRATVSLTTTEYGNGWTVGVEVNGILVHHPDEDLYISEEAAMQAGEEFVSAALPVLH